MSFLRQTIRFEANEPPREEQLKLYCYEVDRTGGRKELGSTEAAVIFRQLSRTTRLREPQQMGLEDQMASAEAEIIPTLMRPSAEELSQRIRHVVWPVGALIIQ